MYSKLLFTWGRVGRSRGPYAPLRVLCELGVRSYVTVVWLTFGESIRLLLHCFVRHRGPEILRRLGHRRGLGRFQSQFDLEIGERLVGKLRLHPLFGIDLREPLLGEV